MLGSRPWRTDWQNQNAANNAPDNRPSTVRNRYVPRSSRTRVHAEPNLPAPEFSVPGGLYTNNQSVRLTCGFPGAAIRYTLDGSEPTIASLQYSSPIQIAESTLVRARVFGDHNSNSVSVSRSYLIAGSDLDDFSSNLPLVFIQTFGQHIPHNQKVLASAHFIDPKGGRSTLANPADFNGRGTINIRGHSSLRYPKRSYHFKTRVKASILGFPKDSDWVLYAPYPDKTLLRDVLAYDLSNRMGQYASRTRFVEVFVNEYGGRLSRRDYLGVYVFEEKIKRGKRRVEIDKLTPEDNAEPNLSGGYIFKKDHFDTVDMNGGNHGGVPMGNGPSYSRPGYPTGPGGFPGDPAGFRGGEQQSYSGQGNFFQMFGGGQPSPGRGQGFTTAHGSQFLFVEPQPEEITPQQKAWLANYLNQFEFVLYGKHFKDPQAGYAAYIEANSFIDHHLLVEVTKNIDGFRFSTFYYKDRGGKIKMGPIWDWNLSFGNANGKQGWIPQYWYWPQLDDQQYSWFRRLFEDPDFAQRYVDRWGELRTNQFAITSLHTRIDALASELGEAQERNYRRWRILGRSVWPNTYVGRSFNDEVNWMKRWIQTRIEWVDEQFLDAPSISLPSGAVPRGADLTLRARAGKVYYTLDGSDPRASGGRVSPSAQLYARGLVLTTDAVVFCRASQGNRWSYPAVARFTVGSSASATGKTRAETTPPAADHPSL